MSDPVVSVKLSVFSSEKQLVASLQFKNNGKNVAFLDLINACIKGELKNNVFEVVPVKAGGTREPALGYRGPRLKRRQPILPDFLRLEPGGVAEANVRLDNGYAFPTGRGTYAVTYSAVHQYPDNDDYWEIASNQVTVSFPQ